MTSTDRAKIRDALDAGLPGNATARPGPFLCYLTIVGLDHEPDPRTATQLRGRIHAAIRTAAEGHQTTYHAPTPPSPSASAATTPQNVSTSSAAPWTPSSSSTAGQPGTNGRRRRQSRLRARRTTAQWLRVLTVAGDV
jgi:hypothetical protein